MAIEKVGDIATSSDFTTYHDIPPSYLAYVDTEALSADLIAAEYKTISNKISSKSVKLEPEDPFFIAHMAPNLKLGVSVYNVKGFHLIRYKLVEHCCDNIQDFLDHYDPSKEPWAG